MSSHPSDPNGPSRITHGAVVVLAHLHETDAACSELYHETNLAESTAYRWLTELEDADVLDVEPSPADDDRSVGTYVLHDDELGDAAQVLVDRLVQGDSSP